MNKKTAFKEAKHIHPLLQTSRYCACSLSNGTLILTGYEHQVALVLYHKDDLMQVAGMCQATLAQQAILKQERGNARANKSLGKKGPGNNPGRRRRAKPQR